VPHVREAAVAGDSALIGGCAAWFLHGIVEATPGGLEATLARSGVPLDRRADVLRAWRVLARSAASGGSNTASAPPVPVPEPANDRRTTSGYGR
jgi:hypothetical protein